MSWTPLTAAPKPMRGAQISLSLSTKRDGGGRLFVTLPLADLPKGWKPGTELDAFIGRNEDLGKLQLRKAAGAPFTLYLNGRATAKCHRLSLKLPLPRGIAAERHPPEKIDVEYGNDVATITLPAWAWPREATAGTKPAAPAKPPAPGAMTDVTTRIFPDPPPGRAAAKR
jgi:hypothetical protein